MQLCEASVAGEEGIAAQRCIWRGKGLARGMGGSMGWGEEASFVERGMRMLGGKGALSWGVVAHQADGDTHLMEAMGQTRRAGRAPRPEGTGEQPWWRQLPE